MFLCFSLYDHLISVDSFLSQPEPEMEDVDTNLLAEKNDIGNKFAVEAEKQFFLFLIRCYCW